MQRVVFSGNRGYKPSIEPASDRLFIPLAVINDLKAQKNGTKKTVFWVKKKKKQEDGTVKGENGQHHNNIQEIGKKIKNMDMVLKSMITKINMKAIGKMILEMVKVLIGYVQVKINIENYIQVIGKITKKKDMVYIFIKMEVVMMANGKILKETEKV